VPLACAEIYGFPLTNLSVSRAIDLRHLTGVSYIVLALVAQVTSCSGRALPGSLLSAVDFLQHSDTSDYPIILFRT
jgi:hypothetical protein